MISKISDKVWSSNGSVILLSKYFYLHWQIFLKCEIFQITGNLLTEKSWIFKWKFIDGIWSPEVDKGAQIIYQSLYKKLYLVNRKPILSLKFYEFLWKLSRNIKEILQNIIKEKIKPSK